MIEIRYNFVFLSLLILLYTFSVPPDGMNDIWKLLHTPVRSSKSQTLPTSSNVRALTKPWRQHQRVREECRGSGCWSESAPFPVTQHRHHCDWEAGEGGSEGREASQRAARAGRDGPGTGGMIAADEGIQPRSLYSVVSLAFLFTEPVSWDLKFRLY